MRWHQGLLVGVVALTLSACAGGQVRGADRSPQPAADTTAPTSQTTESAQTAPANDKTFVYAPNLDVVTDWDPATSYSNEIIAMANIYESLTRYNAQTQKAEPKLATEWTASADGKEWTFKLREGVTFHTGKPLTAEVAKQAIERTIKLNGGAAYIWAPVKTIAAPDPLTLTFSLKYAAPLDLVASSGYASYIYDPDGVSPDGDKDGGSGPYTIDQWAKGKETELTLKAYDGYWGGWKPEQYRKVAFRVTEQVNTAWQLLQSGEVSFVPRLNPQLFQQAAGTQGVQTSSTPSFQNLLLLFNTEKLDPEVRQALQHAIDYDGLVAALKGAGVKASGLVPPGLLGHTPGKEPVYDMAKAHELLQQRGFGVDGTELELSLTYAQGDDDQKLLVTLLTSALKKVNVTVKAKPMQWSAQWDQGKKGGQDIFVMYWYPDYADAYSWFYNMFRTEKETSFNLSYLQDKEIDKLIAGLPALTAVDQVKAHESYADLQRRILDEQAAAAVPYVQTYQRALGADVKGYVDNPAYPNVVFFHDVTSP
ncbi:ABC transporter substrate-binding protein [Nonomuraea sp. NPDC050663]|uniref:ABC transporter substrate-binding protein n=1 Tax=Nonomuraea sp. NPDC050663 TaxID=3364370 RepID=UPI00379D4154